MWWQELDIYLYIYRYHPLDNWYRFSVSVQPEITPLLSVFFPMFKKNVFQKLAGLWLVGKVVNRYLLIMLDLMGLRWPRVARCSNVGHVDKGIHRYIMQYNHILFTPSILGLSHTRLYALSNTLSLSLCWNALRLPQQLEDHYEANCCIGQTTYAILMDADVPVLNGFYWT